MTLASTHPLRDALRSLQRIAASDTRSGTPLNLEPYEPVAVVDSLLSDIASDTCGNGTMGNGVRAVDTAQFVALSTLMYVVDG